MRILYLTQWFEPEPAFKGLAFARAMVARGHQVEVATAFPNYPSGKLYPGYRLRPYQRELMDEIVVHRLFVWPSHDRSAIGRVLNYISFWLSSLVFGLLRAGRYDVVYVYHPPITPAVAAALFGRLRRRPFVMEVQDLWPDSVASSGMVSGSGGRLIRILDALCRFAYRSAAAVIAQSEGMRKQLEERGVPAGKLERIYNWSTYEQGGDPAGGAVRADFTGKVNFVYGGNLGQAQALHTVIDAVALAARERTDLHLHLFGEGIEQDRLMAHAAEKNIESHVTFHGPVPRRTMDRVFDQADVLVLNLKDDPLYEVTIPSKTQHYLSCGKPIVAGLSGEAADILRASGAAIVAAPGDAPAMAAALVSMARAGEAERAALGRHGRAFYEAHLSFAPAIDRTLAIICRAASFQSR